ncbi:hypothetical protein DFP72DRAFT_849883 [Ephemerocybe angulata]|uniref:Uncharacterized protein n=1 Tax=Ephemerocybe angulata TaxID=980116 RepID=A0A8H6HV40_9AGAR|nr:hypothetical protein DFP72DRAFT_849883 [Tulosesus angulatus]
MSSIGYVEDGYAMGGENNFSPGLKLTLAFASGQSTLALSLYEQEIIRSPLLRSLEAARDYTKVAWISLYIEKSTGYLLTWNEVHLLRRCYAEYAFALGIRPIALGGISQSSGPEWVYKWPCPAPIVATLGKGRPTKMIVGIVIKGELSVQPVEAAPDVSCESTWTSLTLVQQEEVSLLFRLKSRVPFSATSPVLVERNGYVASQEEIQIYQVDRSTSVWDAKESVYQFVLKLPRMAVINPDGISVCQPVYGNRTTEQRP